MANYEDRPTANEGLAAAHLPAVLLVEDAPGAWAHRRIELDDMRTRGVYLARGRCLCLPLGREAPPGLLRVRSIQDRQQDAGPAPASRPGARITRSLTGDSPHLRGRRRVSKIGVFTHV